MVVIREKRVVEIALGKGGKKKWYRRLDFEAYIIFLIIVTSINLIF